ncbi:MAG: MCE family protein [Solirubrobacterales bacterium]|nr:MCE family protein [Solirubrobacterales bacterium]
MARLRKDPDAPRVPRKDRRGFNPFTVGALTLLAAAIITYFGFTKDLPFHRGFQMKVVFETSNNLRPNSPVRIAGVNVGKVKKVEGYEGGDGNAAVVTMEIKDEGLPIHKDATVKIRPRIFLEGNFFVDLQPGTPASPTIDDGDTIPVTQTATPVQLDQVLTALQSDTREDLQKFLEGYGTGLTYEPKAADDADQDPAVRGETAAKSLNDALDTGGPALRNAAIVNEALLGLERDDLSGLVKSVGTVMKALGTNERSLQDFVTNFNTTMASFASEDQNLRRTIALLPGTLRHADQAFDSLNASFPNTRAFAREILPGVRETPATIEASYPWIAQTRKLLGEDELRGLSKDLRPATADLAKLVDENLKALPQANLLSQCVVNTILPTGDLKVQDGQFTSGAENYKEFWWTMVGLAGESQNFDGNGQYVRFAVGGGDQSLSTGKYGGNAGSTLIANVNDRPLGTRPLYPGKRPPYNSEAPCKDQKLPNLDAAKSGPPDGGGATAASVRADLRRQNAANAARSSKAGGSGEDDLTAELADRLNPFRAGGGR